ncbi:MAG: DNA polymerase III subunit alpha [Firmicutes bacterium]|nr:DNA polymerase III subunit alpha [Bacillota bacterium]
MKSLLKVTTDYSLLKSMIRIDELIKYCNDYNMPFCGICDNNLFGVMNFYNNCKNNNIKPLIGLDILFEGANIYLYAKNYNGYKNLLKINTIIQTRNIALLDLELHRDDILLVIPFKYINNYNELSEIFNDIYISYESDYEKNNAKIISKNIVFMNDVKALSENSSNYLNYLNMIDNNSTINNYQMIDYKNNVLKDVENKEDIDSINKFVCEINIEIPKGENYIPKYDCKEDSYEHLYNLTHKGLLKRLNNNIPSIYKKRLEYELKVIKNMGFVDYFLIVYDYVLYAKKNGILVGAGRGSAAGSLVSYTLGITDVDPIKYNLLFERFLNPERVTMPDIDIDFENTKRDKVINYVKEKYGSQSVAGIMTYGTLKSKLVLRTIMKCLEIDSRLIDRFVNYIDSKLSLKDNLKDKDVMYFINSNDEIKKAYKISMKLENLKRNISSHAAGVVICSEQLDKIIPICISNDEIFTGVTMEYLEDLGLLKMDFLAIKNLTTISNILEKIEKDSNKKINLNNIDLNDEKVLKLFHDGNTVGIFQFESEGMKNFLGKLKPSNFFDLVSALALFRPGPMDNIDSFIRRKYNREKIDYIHPDLEDILKETYGIIVYQEQIMQILVTIANYSFAEADNIRRAMSKKKKEIIDKEKNNFIKRAVNNGYDKNLAIKIYDLILKFANYGFNKSHSVSYALIGYQMAYLKTYFPGYFYADLLNNVIGIERKTKEYIDDAKKLNFEVLEVDINKSSDVYEVEGNSLRMPFGVIRNIGKVSVENILDERKKNNFIDFIDFIKRCYKNINIKVIESLIKANVFKNFNFNKKTLINNLELIMNYASLVSDLSEEFVEKPEIKIVDDYSDEENRKYEFEMYGFYAGSHPCSKYNDKSIVKIENIKNYYNKIINCVVLIEFVKKIKTKNGDDMAFIDASDETGKITFVLFSNSYDQINNFEKDKIVSIKGRVVKRLDKYQINITDVQA